MILLKSTQRSLQISLPHIKSQIQLMLTAAGYKDWDIGVELTSNRRLRQLNAEYRGKDKPTDILSFPFAEVAQPGKLPAPRSEDDKNLGDIFISIPYVIHWCALNEVDIQDRLPRLYAHGICHLLGYDHEDKKDYRLMKRREDALLKRMKAWEASLLAQPTPPASKETP
ncbi:hypothetical protein BGZ70_000468 [Mortierella alpina]|uniref:Uncharacterized protein n=1 Tax=Mortierella alpina TaxID=64518 RepID=A0A9P6JCP3_MORAP|nr:hypothetical protein BGZ70_000468 [Mortierella alpina]